MSTNSYVGGLLYDVTGAVCTFQTPPKHLFGYDGVGLNVVQGTALVSADPIIAIDMYDQKLRLAREFGATHTINMMKADLRKEIRKIVGSRGVDVFIEIMRQTRLIEAANEERTQRYKFVS